MLNTKKKTRPDPAFGLIFLALILILFTHCTTREAGCLDPDAANFDLDADKSCDGCCTYPTLSLLLSQKWNDQLFTVPDTFFDVYQRPYIIEDIRYFLAAWQWKKTSGETFTLDSIDGSCGVSTLRYVPDMIIIEPQKFDYPIGTIYVAPAIDSINFSIGLTRDYDCLDDLSPGTPVVLKSSSPLFNVDSGRLSSVRLIVNLNPTDTILDTLFIELVKPITVPYSYSFKRGENTKFLLTVNYAPWFSEVNLDDVNSFAVSIANGIEGSIYKSE